MLLNSSLKAITIGIRDKSMRGLNYHCYSRANMIQNPGNVSISLSSFRSCSYSIRIAKAYFSGFLGDFPK